MKWHEIKRRMVFNDVLTGGVMLGLAAANLGARGMQRGTAAYIEGAGAGLLDIMSALLAVCGLILIRRAWGRLPVTRWDFAFLTFPLALYIAATLVYSWETRGPAHGIVLYGGFYILLVKRAWTRPRDGFDE